MNNIKNSFSIQDLETLSGIKAHTIRIWEKRYALLTPCRINRNVRVYNIESLQKILNVSILNKSGMKISLISSFSEKEILEKTRDLTLELNSNDFVINELMIAMFSFDQYKFNQICEVELKKTSFLDFFVHSLVPILNQLGLLWQTDLIKTTHEHFISNLILHKILIKTAEIELKKYSEEDEVYVVFLPAGEIHEIGLLFLNYFLLSKGYRTIYLGRSIPIDDLFDLNANFKKITWVSAMVLDKTYPAKQLIMDDLDKLLKGSDNKCWLIGSKWEAIDSSNVFVFKNFESIIHAINTNTFK